MGCGSSRGSGAVVPMEARLVTNGTAHAVVAPPQAHRRASDAPPIEGREPPAEELPAEPPRDPPRELPTYREAGQAGGVVLAFEVPLVDDEGGRGEQHAPRRPPRRLQRLEDAPAPPSQRLTHQLLDERQEAADERRSQILSQRVQSAAQQRVSSKRQPRDSDNGTGTGSASGSGDGEVWDDHLATGDSEGRPQRE